MVDDARIGAGTAAYRGFLFSDMRGFTAFAERHGNSAAAAKVSRFLEIARRAIARNGGTEATTEGDAIHAVFPSASSAVLCGLEIQDAAAELNAEDPDREIALGVGVHAGEAVETAEGYIGRAVNIAARLCAAAKPGEVLVSSTVKGITQASIQVGFIPRGKRRLKGIEDPIVVYAVTRDTNARAPRAVPRPVLLGAAGAALAGVVVIAVVAASGLLKGPASSPAPSVPPAVLPVAIGQLSIGTYESQVFQPAVTFVVADHDWTANRDVVDWLGLVRSATPRGSVHFLRAQKVFKNACVEGGEGAPAGTGAGDLIAALRGVEHLALSEVQPVQVGGYTGERVEIIVDQGALMACGGLAGGEVALFLVGEEVFRVAPGERFILISVAVGFQPVTIVMSTDWTQTPSTEELESLLQLGDRIVKSVTF